MPKSVNAQTYDIRQVNDALKATGELVCAARKARKWSQAELGKRLGDIDRRHISALESGDPSADFGLVVSALWLLNIPVLTTLPENAQSSNSQKNLVIDALVRMSASSKSSASATVTKRRDHAKKVISNDF